MGHGDSETNQQGRQHRGAVITRVHGGGEHHKHQEHGEQHLHDETPGWSGVVVIDCVHTQRPFLKGGEVKYSGSSDGSNCLGYDINWKISPSKR